MYVQNCILGNSVSKNTYNHIFDSVFHKINFKKKNYHLNLSFQESNILSIAYDWL